MDHKDIGRPVRPSPCGPEPIGGARDSNSDRQAKTPQAVEGEASQSGGTCAASPTPKSLNNPHSSSPNELRLALEDADALERTADDADENGWLDWAATMRQSAQRIRCIARLASSPTEGEATWAEREAKVMQEWRWGNLTKLGVANHLRRAGFRLEVAVEKANALSSPATGVEGDVERLRDALEPFALLAGGDVNMNDPLRKWFTVAQLKDAEDALSHTGVGCGQ